MHCPRTATKRCLPDRWLVTDAARLPDPLPAAAALPRGTGVLFRHYELTAAGRLQLAQRLAELCRSRGLYFVVAGDARLALSCNADGLHLPQGLLHLAAGLACRYPHRALTAAAHDEAAIAQAARAGVDAVLISPVFPTASHPGSAGLGVVRFAMLAQKAQRQGLGVYALGGIDGTSERRLCHISKNGTAAIQGMAAGQVRR